YDKDGCDSLRGVFALRSQYSERCQAYNSQADNTTNRHHVKPDMHTSSLVPGRNMSLNSQELVKRLNNIHKSLTAWTVVVQAEKLEGVSKADDISRKSSGDV